MLGRQRGHSEGLSEVKLPREIEEVMVALGLGLGVLLSLTLTTV
jgi:hypothetical protein